MALILDGVHSQGGHPVFGAGGDIGALFEIGIAVVVDMSLDIFVLVGVDRSQDGLCKFFISVGSKFIHSFFVGLLGILVVCLNLCFFLVIQVHPVSVLPLNKLFVVLGLPGDISRGGLVLGGEVGEDGGAEQQQKDGFCHFGRLNVYLYGD